MDNDPVSEEETPKPAQKPARTRSRSARPRGRAKAEAADAPDSSAPAAETAAEAAPASREESRADTGGSDEVPTSYRAEPGGSGSDESDAGSNQGGHQGRPDHQGGGGGDGGHDQGRGSWKRNKRKRGRHGNGGGNWQPGGGHKGPAHPQQPGPAAAAVVSGDLPPPARFEDLAALDALAGEISSGGDDPIYLDEVYALNLADLNAFARKCGATFEGTLNKTQLLNLIFKATAEAKRPLRDRGYVDINAQGAFIVHQHVNYRLYPEDAYLPESLIKRYGLKRGHRVEVLVQAPLENERCPAVIRIEQVMDLAPDDISKVTPFEELVPYYPLQRILLEAPAVQKDVSMRAVDILTPIGFGQRGLIVAPPRTGKTILLQNIANSVSENFPEHTLILLLIDERPEEVTDFKRHTKGEVVSSTFDETPESHVHCAEMVGEKARRLVEQGKHVVILLDSITRLARAYNALTGNSGKIMSGGMEATALQKPKRFFGAARNIEGAGSLTIIGTALVDTGSRMDEVIFEEFKGTGNMELHLDRGLVERRIFPAINIDRSGTRKEELIYHPDELQKIYGLRRAMQGLGPIESMEMLIQRLKKTKSNAEFLLGLR
ncbi:MAG: hypothetical protein RIS54_1609 [Verrucomicrobiota bacterium]|jgi:transcription termination factor Rho